MNQADLKERTTRFALDVLYFCRSIQDTWEGRRIGGQLFDAAAPSQQTIDRLSGPVEG
jgi:hypothetical protein